MKNIYKKIFTVSFGYAFGRDVLIEFGNLLGSNLFENSNRG
jgi:hypothetical protein